jgi:DNA polymerase III epsilon subunit-like protein
VIIHFTDTETTGLDPVEQGAEIVELAVATWDSERDGLVTEVYHKGFLAVRGCPPEAAKINGYNEAEWLAAGAKHFTAADAAELCKLFEGALIGGSNPDFDKRMIQAECHRAGKLKPRWSHRSLNTASLGFPLWVLGEVESAGLVPLAAYFGIEHDAHTAMGDVRASIAVWEAFIEMYWYRPKRMREALEFMAENDLRPTAERAAEALVP